MRKPIPKKPKIVLLANGKVGLAVARYLKSRKENIVVLVVHPKRISRLSDHIKKAKLSDEIKKAVCTKNVFYATQLRNPQCLSKIKKLNPDIAISAWFSYILKKEFLDIFPCGVINFHNAFLPFNRGRHPSVWAIYNGSKNGITLHYIDQGIDTGDIIARKEIKPEIIDAAADLYEKARKQIIELFKEIWPKLRVNNIKAQKQNNRIATHHFAKEIEEIDFIDWNKRYLAKDLINKMRAGSFNGKGHTFFIHKGKKIYLNLKLYEEKS